MTRVRDWSGTGAGAAALSPPDDRAGARVGAQAASASAAIVASMSRCSLISVTHSPRLASRICSSMLADGRRMTVSERRRLPTVARRAILGRYLIISARGRQDLGAGGD